MANFQGSGPDGKYTMDDIKANFARQLAGGRQGGMMGMAQMQPVPQQQGLFAGLSAYNPEWMKDYGSSGAMPYAQFAANQNVAAAGAAMPDLAAQQAQAAATREEWLRQQQMQMMGMYQQQPRGQLQGNGDA